MQPNVHVRQARPGDEPVVVALVRELAATGGWSTPIDEAYAGHYLAAPGSGVLLAERAGQVVGLLSFTVRPNLFHAGDTALIEELIVHEGNRGQGVGDALLRAWVEAMRRRGCIEVSVSTMPDNEGARRFYRAHGLLDESLLLEMHLVEPS